MTPHQNIESLVEKFSQALVKKLKLAHANGKRGWEKEDWLVDCQMQLLEHVKKGDPLDVAAYCAFMWHHGWSVATHEEIAIELHYENKDHRK